VRFVVTAGPTREPIDPVRFLSNRSSGKMGYAVAEAAIEAGHEVTLISGPVCLLAPDGAHVVSIQTSDEMYEAVRRAVGDCDVLVMCAAVADYKPAKYSEQKLKKKSAAWSLDLAPTRDILASIADQNRSFLVVGFAAETENVVANAEKKIRAKNCDMLVANDVSSSAYGMESAENEVTIFFRNGETKQISRAPKKNIARELVKIISNIREKCLTKKT
jgi:phosphopantothenoylcysteine decarboxylase / phosphopantothenate---cysteine ligase